MGQERDGSPIAHKPKVPIVMSTPQNLEVLYEDNHIIAVNKRSSDIVQGDITNDRTLDNVIREYLRVKYDKPGEAWLGTIHRIDRPVSGVILYAKTSKCLSRMMKALLESAEKEIAAMSPRGRIGQDEDMAAATIYLASPGSSYLTGVILPVDGGYSTTAG